MKALLRYPGGKTLLAPWIVSHFPAHESYLEPFVGGAAVLLRKKRVAIEAVNDLNGELVNLLIVLRDQPDELIQLIESTYYARDEWELALVAEGSQLERARRFFTRCFLSFRPFDSAMSFRRQRKYSGGMVPASKLFAKTEHLHGLAARLRGVCIENIDAFEFIKIYDYPGALFYVDPPYVFSARKTNKALYSHDSMSDADHVRLYYLLNDCTGMVVVSGYASDLYADTYEKSGWLRRDKNARTSGDDAVESVWLSPAVVEAADTGIQGMLL